MPEKSVGRNLPDSDFASAGHSAASGKKIYSGQLRQLPGNRRKNYGLHGFRISGLYDDQALSAEGLVAFTSGRTVSGVYKNRKQLDLCQPFGSRYVCGFGSRPEIRNLLPDRRFRPVRKNQPRNRHPGDCAVRQHICCGQKRVRNLSAVCGKQPCTKTPGGVGKCKCPERSVAHPHGNRMARSFLFLR